MKLSIFLSGIRTENWLPLYQSIPLTTTLPKEEYELIIVSPYDAPPELEAEPNVKIIKDWGHPSRCYQLGLINSTGEFVVCAVDDGVFSPTMAIDKALAARPNHHKGIVTLKYLEGKKSHKAKQQTGGDAYWRLGSHPFFRDLPYVPNDYYLIMIFCMRRDYLMEIGGFDCSYEHVGIGIVDLAVRLQNDGAEVVLGDYLTNISLLKRASGDHGPVFLAQMEHDQPLFSSMYSHPSSAGKTKVKISNWKQEEDVWSRRFGKGKLLP